MQFDKENLMTFVTVKKILFICLVSPLFLWAQPSEKSSLRALIRGLEEPQGKVAVVLTDYLGESISEHWLFVNDNEVLLEIDKLEAGRYALKFFHDANNNGTMDKNFFGIPTEMFGFSNDAKLRLGPPAIEDMLFVVDGDTEIVVNARKL
ncbi:MAG: DUF2141 domain-containing protein [Flavobacteriales bacterium]|nr:DUF2141 domain-containing protein [Flavobacteriales bacterium]